VQHGLNEDDRLFPNGASVVFCMELSGFRMGLST